mgnify:CR=1 FL=1
MDRIRKQKEIKNMTDQELTEYVLQFLNQSMTIDEFALIRQQQERLLTIPRNIDNDMSQKGNISFLF